MPGVSMTVDIDPLDLVDPARFARDGYPHHVWTRLRAEAPVAYIEPPGHAPFWAITKHADILAIERDNELFLNDPRPVLTTAAADDMAKEQLEAGNKEPC